MLDKLLSKIKIRQLFKARRILNYIGIGSLITFIIMIVFAYYKMYTAGFIVGLIISNLITYLMDRKLYNINLTQMKWNLNNLIYTTIGACLIIGSIQFVINL